MTVLDLSEPITLESGCTLDHITVTYQTWGRRNSDQSNVILICHALTGDSNVADDDGWWTHYVGKSKVIDTSRFYVICMNVLGSCKGTTGPASINPITNKPYGTDFPIVTIGDMVKVQKMTLDALGITQLYAIVGASMGGMQALEWTIQYPLMMKRCLLIATTSRLSTQALAFNTVGRKSILSNPTEGLSIARMIGHITYLSDESLNQKFGRRLQEKDDYGFSFSTDFQIESYLSHQGQKILDEFDPISYIYLSKALSYFDLERTYSSLEQAFKRTQVHYFFIGISSDWIYPPKQSLEMVNMLVKLNKSVSYSLLESPYGHDSFLLPSIQLSSLIDGFLCRN